MTTVILFTKAGCGLCDEVKHKLEAIQATYPHQLREIDITQDKVLFAKYRYMIPVVQIGEQELAAPITAVQLQSTLKNQANSSL
jgi:glutaredoxin